MLKRLVERKTTAVPQNSESMEGVDARNKGVKE